MCCTRRVRRYPLLCLPWCPRGAMAEEVEVAMVDVGATVVVVAEAGDTTAFVRL